MCPTSIVYGDGDFRRNRIDAANVVSAVHGVLSGSGDVREAGLAHMKEGYSNLELLGNPVQRREEDGVPRNVKRPFKRRPLDNKSGNRSREEFRQKAGMVTARGSGNCDCASVRMDRCGLKWLQPLAMGQFLSRRRSGYDGGRRF